MARVSRGNPELILGVGATGGRPGEGPSPLRRYPHLPENTQWCLRRGISSVNRAKTLAMAIEYNLLEDQELFAPHSLRHGQCRQIGEVTIRARYHKVRLNSNNLSRLQGEQFPFLPG